MASIHGKNTRPEMLVRRYLHRLGFRFRIHDKRYPGRPDLILPKHRVAIFVYGCFWHGHERSNFRAASTRADWWKTIPSLESGLINLR
jgi:DNA mismatch endonuclease (patch repair protein)